MYKKRVFISAINIKCSGAPSLNDFNSVIKGTQHPSFTNVNIANEKLTLGEAIEISTSAMFYPSRSNEKVMRSEVIGSVVCVQELLNGLAIPDHLIQNIPLYISSGVCFERQEADLDWFSKALQATLICKTAEEKNKKINQSVPPLLALRTLTNSASSFVSLYSKLAGNNTTFGNSSQSAYFSLKEGYNAIQTGKSDLAVAGGANRGGISSYFMFKNFNPSDSHWKESTCAAFVLLESEESIKKRKAKSLCEITDFQFSKLPPDLMNRRNGKSFILFEEYGKDADLCITSGAFRESEYMDNKKNAGAIWKEVYSLYPLFGNLGAVSVFMNIGAAIYFINENNHNIVDCLDKDPYKRESLVRLKKPIGSI